MGNVADYEHSAVAYCTKPHGARPIPNGAFKGFQVIITDEYIQIGGQGNFTKTNIRNGDWGGELDNRGATGYGNPCKWLHLSILKIVLTRLSWRCRIFKRSR